MQSAYKAELDGLIKEGIITEVHEHTEWINSIVPVMKKDGSLRLCLDPKDLNKAIERNQWYARMKRPQFKTCLYTRLTFNCTASTLQDVTSFSSTHRFKVLILF